MEAFVTRKALDIRFCPIRPYLSVYIHRSSAARSLYSICGALIKCARVLTSTTNKADNRRRNKHAFATQRGRPSQIKCFLRETDQRYIASRRVGTANGLLKRSMFRKWITVEEHETGEEHETAIVVNCGQSLTFDQCRLYHVINLS